MAEGIKDEPMEVDDFFDKIFQFMQTNEEGVTDEMIKNLVPDCTPQQRVMVINKLLTSGKIDVLKKGTILLYKMKDGSASSQVKGGDHQEKLVYQIIQEAGNKGIWIRDIRYKCNLLLTQVNKILKSLESKKLIKAVKSVAASKKKVYMLYDLEPDRSVTGGAWYSDQDFESEFVEVLNQQCFKFLEQKASLAKETKVDPISQRNASYTSLKEVWKYISELGISKVQLSIEDIEAILNTLIYDGKVERTLTAGSSDADQQANKLYRAIKPLTSTTGLMRMPCGVCPVFDKCCEGKAVSPTNCIYIKEWLDT